MEPVATKMPWGSNWRQTISILWPTKSCSFSPVTASQILAFLSKEPVTTLLLFTEAKVSQKWKYLPKRFIESHGVHDICVFSQIKEFFTCNSVPNFASSIIWASDEFVSSLVESTVGQWQQVSTQSLEAGKSLVFILKLFLDQLLDQSLQLWLAWLWNKRLFK